MRYYISAGAMVTTMGSLNHGQPRQHLETTHTLKKKKRWTSYSSGRLLLQMPPPHTGHHMVRPHTEPQYGERRTNPVSSLISASRLGLFGDLA